MYKACSRCGRIHPANVKCYAGRERKETTASKIRSRNRWKQKAKQIKEDAQYICEYCRAHGKITTQMLEVHHIVPLEEDDSLAFDDDNLICLCNACHRDAEAGKISREELHAIVTHREGK